MTEELDKAIADASAEAEKEVSAGQEEVKPEEAAPAEEAPEEEKPSKERDEHGRFKPKAEAKEEEAEEDLGLSAEELALVNSDPKLLKTYKSMQRGLTKKSQSIAEQRKLHEDAVKVAAWLQEDPDGAVRAIAAARGIKIAEDASKAEQKEVKSEISDALESEWLSAFGEQGKPAINVLRPLFEKTAAKVVENIIKREVEPLRAQTAELSQAATARGISAATREFGAKVTEEGGTWDDEVQAEMAKVMEYIEPTQGTPIDEYLGTLYKVVSYERGRRSAAKEQLKRIRAAKVESEPISSVRPAKEQPQGITPSMSENDAIALAVSMAEKELRR